MKMSRSSPRRCAPLPEASDLQIARAAAGVSTIVYRIGCPAGVYYLRIHSEPGATFAAEAAVHRRLRALGLHVPVVLHMDPLHPVLGRSLMLTTAVAGQAIGYVRPPAAAPAVVRAAGRELAILNQVRVHGYGWLNRLARPSGASGAEPGAEPAAEYPTLPQWLHAHFAAPLDALGGSAYLSGPAAGKLPGLLDCACDRLREEPAVLAHGDFDVTHIFHRRLGARTVYSGIIDFGEIRGAHWLYDLGHFAVEGERLLPHLLEGYGEITPLTAADLHTLRLTSLLIAARRIGRRLQQQRTPHGPDVAYLVTHLGAFDCDRQR